MQEKLDLQNVPKRVRATRRTTSGTCERTPERIKK